MASSSEPRIFSPEWLSDVTAADDWVEAFLHPFFAEDPTLLNKTTKDSIGIVLYTKPNGDVVPVGFTALQDGNFIFQYHPNYDPQEPAISYIIPRRSERYQYNTIPPFFDNLLAEGWFGEAQISVLNTRSPDMNTTESLDQRYHRLMMFGRGAPGAIWAIYARVDPEIEASNNQGVIKAAIDSRSHISGQQKKILGTMGKDGILRPNIWGVPSTHILKLANEDPSMPGIMEYEYMAHVATRKLLPPLLNGANDTTVDMQLTDLLLENGTRIPVLAIKRFDRTEQGGRIHFEELNQLLGKSSSERYQGYYTDIADFIREKMGKDGVKQFYARLLCQFILGNTDSHFKNFAMFNEQGTWSLTPEYDLLPTANYSELGHIALRMDERPKPKTTNQDNVKPMSSETSRALGGLHPSALAEVEVIKSEIASAGESRKHGKPEKPFKESSIKLSTIHAKELIALGIAFQLDISEITEIINGMLGRVEVAKQAVLNDPSPQLDKGLAMDERGRRHSGRMHFKQGNDTTFRQDFCSRIDGRCHQLFGSMNKYLGIVSQKSERRGQFM